MSGSRHVVEWSPDSQEGGGSILEEQNFCGRKRGKMAPPKDYSETMFKV